uniref:Cytochrome P450 n=1 Tax=Bionectria ochroleuca TaxID=29856 RepID=A0A8H7K5B4_BIOOC
MARDKEEHARRRKVWDQGFSTKALLGYDSRITKAIDELLQVIDRDHNQPINITKWFDFFVFDVMEDLAFNKNSNMIRHGEDSYIFQTIRTDMFNIAFFAHLPWLLPFLKRTPVLNWNYIKFWNWIQNQINERRKNEPDQPDIFSWLLNNYDQGKKTRKDDWNLHGDAQLIVIAGSDSVAATLTHIFYELAYDANLTKILQDAFDALPSLENSNLINVELLDAVINETLRLHPPVPSGTQRVTPPGGLRIGSRLTVSLRKLSLADPRNFERPTEFLPDRWTEHKELIKNKSVFIPFNMGPYACVGKRLALMEIRRVTAEILTRYDITVAPGYEKGSFLGKKQDTFTVVSGPLPLIFTPRTP